MVEKIVCHRCMGVGVAVHTVTDRRVANSQSTGMITCKIIRCIYELLRSLVMYMAFRIRGIDYHMSYMYQLRVSDRYLCTSYM